jgi:hypothetical protein
MKKVIRFGAVILLTGIMGVASFAQTTATKTEVVQNADGTYTVIEYPVGQEVMVNLTPSAKLAGAQGVARVVRTADGTKVVMNLTSVPGDTSSYYAYAVDAAGNPTLLGPVVVEKGLGNAEFTTPMNQFMLVLSPTEEWKSVDDTAVVFRSEVPKGYAVVKTATTSLDATKTVAVSDAVTSTYDVPLLNVPAFNNKTTEIRIAFAGDLDGLKGKAYIDPGQKGVTQVKMRFDDMKLAPKDKRFVLWASSADGQYTKLGQVINTGRRQESEIRSETALKDFGLFVTMEDTDVTLPTGKTYSVFGLPKQP